ncbi:MAG: PKD domain-containing protein [Ferruginibacter sp.]
MICGATIGAQISDPIPFTIYQGSSSTLYEEVSVAKTNQFDLFKFNDDPCITGDQSGCYYTIVSYVLDNYELPVSATGYTISYQRCCRIAGMQNVTSSDNVGDTWTIKIPGTAAGVPNAEKNSSPSFPINDTAVICGGNYFTYPVNATDPDGDSLVYTLCSAYLGGGNILDPQICATCVSPDPATPPPYTSVPYSSPFSGSQPLGSRVTINPVTGLISGIAPANASSGPDEYVVTICVQEYRNGIYFADSRKELHIRVKDCIPLRANPTFSPVTCDGFTVTLSQESSGNPSTFFWDFGDPTTGAANTSSDLTPTHTFSDTGVFNIKLVVSLGGQCIDSVTKPMKVYPGFFPKLSVAGQCKNTPIQFTDLTTANYGSVNQWSWNFGDAGSSTNTSTQKNPTHIYPVENTYNVHFVVSSSKGCTGTIDTAILITDRPAIKIPDDTLICTIDTLQLNAIGTGTFLWSPNYNISNVNISNPLVSPDISTTYFATLTDPFGCIGRDSVKVSVLDHITQFAPNDSTICKTDGIVLKLVSNALSYQWTEIPAGNTLSDPKAKNPVATPVTNTRYHVVSSVGKCTAQSDVVIKPVPYPDADAGADQTICFGKSAQLSASGGSSYSWTPAAFLNNRLIYNPVSVNPTANIRYVVTVTDTLGCPKPVHDTVMVFVAKIKADAGPRDTSVVLDQPLLLQATGSTNYLWSPAQWLSNIGISNPVSLPKDDIEYIVKVSNDAGCFDYDSTRVHVFKLDAGMYVPNAFTPNGDGNNDYFHPIILGMKSLDIFRVYNRWGQMVYSGTDAQKGWDGSFGGKPQDPATYVWYAEGTDYRNNKIKRKGYVVLIR